MLQTTIVKTALLRYQKARSYKDALSRSSALKRGDKQIENLLAPNDKAVASANIKIVRNNKSSLLIDETTDRPTQVQLAILEGVFFHR